MTAVQLLVQQYCQTSNTQPSDGACDAETFPGYQGTKTTSLHQLSAEILQV